MITIIISKHCNRLLYDGTPNEVALNFKTKGNDAMSGKKYRDALNFYTNGINIRPDEKSLLGGLLSNRALANLKLGNFGAAGKDSREALKLDSGNVKARHRLVKSLLMLEKYCDARKEYELLPDDEKQNPELLDLFKKEGKTRDKSLELALRARGLSIVPGCEQPIMAFLQGMSSYPSMEVIPGQERSFAMSFPVVLVYPQASQFDLIQRFNEDDTLYSQISTVLEEPATWDPQHIHRIENIDHCYFIDQQDPSILHKIDLNLTLGSLLGTVINQVEFGLLAIFIIPKGKCTKKFISKFDKVVIKNVS